MILSYQTVQMCLFWMLYVCFVCVCVCVCHVVVEMVNIFDFGDSTTI